MTVICLQKPKQGPMGVTYDISPALEYGDIKFIFDAYENPSSAPAESLEKVRKVLDTFVPETDYLCAAGGDPYGLLLLGFALGECNLPIKWIKFERYRKGAINTAEQSLQRPGYYVPVIMPEAAY